MAEDPGGQGQRQGRLRPRQQLNYRESSSDTDALSALLNSSETATVSTFNFNSSTAPASTSEDNNGADQSIHFDNEDEAESVR